MNWDTTRDLPWAKVHDRFFTSPSHVDLEDVTLLVGIRMLLLANRRGRQPDGSGHVVNGAGQPMSVAAIAREAHSTPERVTKAIGELVAVGTLQDLGGGLYSFPGLQEYQESPSAARQRQSRTHSAPHSAPHSARTVPPHVRLRSQISEVRDQRSEVRGQTAEEERTSAPSERTGADVRPLAAPSPEPLTLIPVERPPAEDVVLRFPATGKHPTWPLTRKLRDELQARFPELDVTAVLDRALGKIATGAVRKPTATGYPRFVWSWLDREMSSARGRGSGPGRLTAGDTSAIDEWLRNAGGAPDAR